MPMAKCLQALKIRKAWIVHGQDGLDEITTTSKTDVIEVSNDKIKKFIINPEKLNIKKSKISDIRGKNPEYNAKQIELLFLNKMKNNFYEDIVALNVAAILVIAERCKNLQKGYQLAKENIKNGNAFKKLIEMRKMSL